MRIPPWLELHAAVTHFPIALLLASLAFEVGAAVWRKPEWKVVGFWTLALGVACLAPTLGTGLMLAAEKFRGVDSLPNVFVLHRLGAVLTACVATAVLALRVARRDNLAGASRAVASLGAFAAAALAGFTGYQGGEMVLGARVVPEAAAGTTASRPAVNLALAATGERLVQSDATGCLNCHRVDGRGAATGINLDGAGLRQPDIAWQIEHLKQPDKVRPGSTMPSYAHLSPEELRAIATYLVSR